MYSGRITLCQGTERAPWAHNDTQMGWGALATEGVEVYQIPGSHTGMYKKPEALALVDKLSACLQKAQARASFDRN